MLVPNPFHPCWYLWTSQYIQKIGKVCLSLLTWCQYQYPLLMILNYYSGSLFWLKYLLKMWILKHYPLDWKELIYNVWDLLEPKKELTDWGWGLTSAPLNSAKSSSNCKLPSQPFRSKKFLCILRTYCFQVCSYLRHLQ